MKQQTLKQIEALPTLTVEKIIRNGTHEKIYLNTPAGKQLLVVSITASDWRATLNNRAILRRWARGEA
jgi:predicted Ser/Thr protein kinase